MNTREQLQNRLDELKRDYRAARSMLEMMAKGTKPEDLMKMKREDLDPIEREIKQLEEDLSLLA
jgi:hypothetical protein